MQLHKRTRGNPLCAGKGQTYCQSNSCNIQPTPSNQCIAHLPLEGGDTLRIVTNYTHLGTIATIAERSSKHAARRHAAAQTTDKTKANKLLSGPHVLFTRNQLGVAAIHAAVMYATTAWTPFELKHMDRSAATYALPVQRMDEGAWAQQRQTRPMPRRQALVIGVVLWPETALRVSQLRMLARLLRGPLIVCCNCYVQWLATTGGPPSNMIICSNKAHSPKSTTESPRTGPSAGGMAQYHLYLSTPVETPGEEVQGHAGPRGNRHWTRWAGVNWCQIVRRLMTVRIRHAFVRNVNQHLDARRALYMHKNREHQHWSSVTP